MNAHTSIARADSYLNVEWSDSRSPWTAKQVRPFITISRESGSGGTSLARALARALNAKASEDVSWTIYEGNLVKRMLRENRLSTGLDRFLPEDRISEVHSSVGEWVGLHPSLWELTQKTVETMAGLARGGHAILVGRGANFATADIPGGVHVRLVAPAGYRARYISRLYGLTESEALAYNAKRDAERSRYVASIFGKKVTEESVHDLVINTSRISINEAVAQIATLIQARSPR
jgi:cytidylate kinase